jgi:hypothetical protein
MGACIFPRERLQDKVWAPVQAVHPVGLRELKSEFSDVRHPLFFISFNFFFKAWCQDGGMLGLSRHGDDYLFAYNK